ncbi:PaaI family thioesterase [Paracoccus laeviglucosivorans]|uniref:Uncharacterized domain 1-containing protein n=1 Tax=Paracoccus laeviglucosivorans TaxID=1197861 RepID=A0A521DG87_9RHOB|nr:PaaI family thioesterase [Paracoccus laeviglucosivorans]SMO70723.1 uncharacterized domain 1-containing protein [Paracoccus laeviglucosivorans]
MTISEKLRLPADRPHLSRLLGIRLIAANEDEVIAELTATPELSNINGVLHGGAIMAFADNLGGMATMVNLAPDEATTTIESKTNFLRPVRIGDVATGRAIALHKGRKTQIWQTTITRSDGKVAAIVTQTQMVMKWQEPGSGS